METLNRALILTSAALLQFGIEVDPIELMHHLLIAQEAAQKAL